MNRYEKGKSDKRHDFLHLHGELTQDIYDISIFIFGYDVDTKLPFIVNKSVGPDALPIASKKRMKKVKTKLLIPNENANAEENEGENENAIDNLSNILQRKEFILTFDETTNDVYDNVNSENKLKSFE